MFGEDALNVFPLEPLDAHGVGRVRVSPGLPGALIERLENAVDIGRFCQIVMCPNFTASTAVAMPRTR